MFKFYETEAIPKILSEFKIQDIIISGLSDESVMDTVLEYCKNQNANYKLIDSKYHSEGNVLNDYTLNVLPNLNNFDAIFLNDDPNWYTVFNELNLIKEINDEFPLVFICHSIFPYKRRDAYLNPDIIPEEFINEYSKGLSINQINVDDGFYHAVKENTSKNGVLTAVEDFLAQNPEIGIFNVKLNNGIIILYSKNDISQLKLEELAEEIEEYSLEFDEFLDFQFENNLLKKYINNVNLSKQDLDSLKEFNKRLEDKDKIISDYEHKIRIYDDKISNETAKVEEINSELSLKDSQIKNFESKLVNNENEINVLTEKLKDANLEISTLNHKLGETENKFKDNRSNLNSNIVLANNKINLLEENIKQKETNFNARENNLLNKLENKEAELNNANAKINNLMQSVDNLESMISKKDNEISNKSNQISTLNDTIVSFNSLKQQYTNQLSKLDKNEYCISCFKEEITNNHLEIEYLKNESFTKKLFSPFAYLYLILKSNPRELSLNFKLYKALKNSKCFDIGYYLNNNTDLLESKWCKVFSPELHYVCNGFREERKFNKKYFNRNSKEELLDYIQKCK